MAVELKSLYESVGSEYDLKLLTSSCFGKEIGWVHLVEREEFIPLLHGDELVFNSGMDFKSEEWLRNFIDLLVSVGASGLIISIWAGRSFSPEIIEYCNKIHFPLFSASLNTPYIDVMRKFSEILLENEQRETNLIAALKNAIYFPEEERLYLNHFERNGFFRDMSYTVIMLSCYTYDTESGNERLKRSIRGERPPYHPCCRVSAQPPAKGVWENLQKGLKCICGDWNDGFPYPGYPLFI